MKYIYNLNDIPENIKDSCGGKALSLARMIGARKLPVPYGSVITSDAFEGGKIRPEALTELNGLTAALDRGTTYAVRSSALNEDGCEKSYAGQYETVTDVAADNIIDAVMRVAASSGNSNVREYSADFGVANEGIAVIIQRFVKPQFAGVIFTSDVITGTDSHLIGNYVKGEGERLVSGIDTGDSFRINAVRYDYDGPDELRPYAKRLTKYCRLIRNLYGMPTDIEWAISGGKVYILQARPITTLKRLDMSTYYINGTMSGNKLLTKTNVGEIFMKPISPMTFSVLEKINNMLGLPDWLDNIYGQPYMNVSVMCSALVAFGKSEEAAFEAIKDLVGNIPEGTAVPISPFYKRQFLSHVKRLLFPENKVKMSRKRKHEMVLNLPDICRGKIDVIRKIDDLDSLLNMWNNDLLPRINEGLASILSECGTSMIPLFGSRKKITKIAGSDMANRLLGGSLGVIDCMKPLLLLDKVSSGNMTREEYVLACGHRSANEMELMSPRPYEDPAFPGNVIEEHIRTGADLQGMLDKQQQLADEALAEFKSMYPDKSRWIDKELIKFRHANEFREDIRSKGVWLFSAFREFILRAGRIEGIGDDIFFLTFGELFEMLDGHKDALKFIPARKATYARYLEYPSFPNLIMGRFDPDTWMADPDRRSDRYFAGAESLNAEGSDIKGFPGAAGTVTGKVKVIMSTDDIDQVEQGDILVTVATNIGWTLVFPKVSAIVTDIGAPLSHAAIVAREFGIPAVVGCGNATTLLKTGDIVTVDGASGSVTINAQP